MKNTKDLIIEESYKLFLTKSYEGVSINDISKACGLTKGALYHHFKSKEEILITVIDNYIIHYINDITSLYEKEVTFSSFIKESIKKAEEILNSIYQISSKFLPVSYISLIVDGFRYYPEFIEKNKNLFSDEIKRLSNLIKKSIKNGEIRSDINVETVAEIYLTLSLGIGINLLHSESSSMALKAYNKQLNELYNLIKV